MTCELSNLFVRILVGSAGGHPSSDTIPIPFGEVLLVALEWISLSIIEDSVLLRHFMFVSWTLIPCQPIQRVVKTSRASRAASCCTIRSLRSAPVETVSFTTVGSSLAAVSSPQRHCMPPSLDHLDISRSAILIRKIAYSITRGMYLCVIWTPHGGADAGIAGINWNWNAAAGP